MALYKYNGELLPEKRGIFGSVFGSPGRTDHGLSRTVAVRRGRRFGRIIKPSFLIWVLLIATLFLLSFALFGLKLLFPGNVEADISTSEELQIVAGIETGISTTQEVQNGGNGDSGNISTSKEGQVSIIKEGSTRSSQEVGQKSSRSNLVSVPKGNVEADISTSEELQIAGGIETGISTTQEVENGGNGDSGNISPSKEGQVSTIKEGSTRSSEEVGQESSRSYLVSAPKSRRRKQHSPCEVGFAQSVEYFIDPKDVNNFTQFSLEYITTEEKPLETNRFSGHQTLKERERSFYARNQTLHCGFVKGAPGFPSTGFDLHEKDKAYMSTCQIVVSSCIFGSSDFLRRPTSNKISEFSKKNVCFVMFVDEETLSKLSSDGNRPNDGGYIGLWRILIVKNLPYEDMRRTGKVPKFLSHRLFPSSRYSIWIDSKLRLNTDPMLIIEYFLWRTRSEYAISNHYDRHCVWEEVLQNKRLNKYNHTAIDEQFTFYQSDGLTKFDPSDSNALLPSFVPEGSFIVRAHTPMSNLFSCLWFNEVDRFTSRDQLSFAYTYLKLRRLNPERPFYVNMFKDCERRALTKLFRHRVLPSPPPGP